MDAKGREELIARLKDSFGEIETLVRGLDEDALLKSPGAGRRSVQEILGHLRDMERVCYRGRLHQIQKEETPFFPDWDGERAADQADYLRQETGEILREWRDLRNATLRLLQDTPLERWSRKGSHEKMGSLSFEKIALSIHEHDLTYLGRILSNLADLRGPRGDVE